MARLPKPPGNVVFDFERMGWRLEGEDPNPFVDWQVDIERLKARRKLEEDMGRAAREAQQRAEVEMARANFIRAMEDPQPPPQARVVGNRAADFLVFDDVEAVPGPELEVNEHEEEEEDGPDDREPEEHPVDRAARRPARLRDWVQRPAVPGELGQIIVGDPFRKQPMLNIKEGPSGYRGMTERSTRLPRFKLEYASQDEARMRLEGTLITVQDRMVKVQRIQTVKQDGEVGSGCIAMDENGDMMYLLFSVDGMNFRSPDPGFIQIGNEAFYFRRKPARVYKQGINGENTYFSKAGRTDRTPLFGAMPDHVLIRAFNERPIILFDEANAETRQSTRLSDRVAVFKKNGGRLHVQHRDFILGPLEKGNKVKVENNCPWVENALNAVGIQAIPVEG